MKIKGDYTLNATSEVIWELLMDPSVLEKITPGIKTLKEKEKDRYTAVSQLKVGPVSGSFEGELALKDKIKQERCTVAIDQKSKMGNVKAEIGMQLEPAGANQTQIQYTGEARMSGMLASMGQRIMSGVVRTLSKQFFQALEEEIEQRQ